MKKIKIFLNPIDQIPKWLNNLARKGYRLKSVNNFVYNFEKTNAKFKYFVEFIGHNPNSYNLDYINRLNNSGHKCFRVPLNQMNISYGKIKFRPLARNGAKISTSFDNYNKEFLIIEFTDNEKINSIISNNDIAVSSTLEACDIGTKSPVLIYNNDEPTSIFQVFRSPEV